MQAIQNNSTEQLLNTIAQGDCIEVMRQMPTKEPLHRGVIFRRQCCAGCLWVFGRFMLVFALHWRLFSQPPGAVLPEYCQSFAVQVEVSEREVRA